METPYRMSENQSSEEPISIDDQDLPSEFTQYSDQQSELIF